MFQDCNDLKIEYLSLRWEATRITPAVLMMDYVYNFKEIINKNKLVKLKTDILYFQGLMFLSTVIRNLQFKKVEIITDIKK